jgi:DNA repair exonuclease SbcCD ATPase subunit
MADLDVEVLRREAEASYARATENGVAVESMAYVIGRADLDALLDHVARGETERKVLRHELKETRKLLVDTERERDLAHPALFERAQLRSDLRTAEEAKAAVGRALGWSSAPTWHGVADAVTRLREERERLSQALSKATAQYTKERRAWGRQERERQIRVARKREKKRAEWKRVIERLRALEAERDAVQERYLELFGNVARVGEEVDRELEELRDLVARLEHDRDEFAVHIGGVPREVVKAQRAEREARPVIDDDAFDLDAGAGPAEMARRQAAARRKLDAMRGEARVPVAEVAQLRAIRDAAEALHRMLTTRGIVDNHGHRRPGSACEVCQVVNDLEDKLAAARGTT